MDDSLQHSQAVKERFDRIRQRPIVLDVDQVGKRFASAQGEVEALRDISFQVHKREFVCVIGPSGCGKSTLIRILAGLETPSSGQILLGDEPVSGPCPDRGMVFQGYTLFPWLTVKKNVMFGLLQSGQTQKSAANDADQWIELVGLSQYASHYPHQLSGGMKQRVAIARALANQPKILLMDEPFGALDAQTRARMQSYLLEIWRNIDITILFITHDLDEAVYLADRILVLKAHPGEVNEIIEVPVPQPRSPDQFASDEFMATRRYIENLIHPPGEEDDTPLNMMRMVSVDDDVGSVL